MGKSRGQSHSRLEISHPRCDGLLPTFAIEKLCLPDWEQRVTSHDNTSNPHASRRRLNYRQPQFRHFLRFFYQEN